VSILVNIDAEVDGLQKVGIFGEAWKEKLFKTMEFPRGSAMGIVLCLLDSLEGDVLCGGG